GVRIMVLSGESKSPTRQPATTHILASSTRRSGWGPLAGRRGSSQSLLDPTYEGEAGAPVPRNQFRSRVTASARGIGPGPSRRPRRAELAQLRGVFPGDEDAVPAVELPRPEHRDGMREGPDHVRGRPPVRVGELAAERAVGVAGHTGLVCGE